MSSPRTVVTSTLEFDSLGRNSTDERALENQERPVVSCERVRTNKKSRNLSTSVVAVVRAVPLSVPCAAK